MKPYLFGFNTLLFPNFNYSKCFSDLLGQNRVHKILYMLLLLQTKFLTRSQLATLKTNNEHYAALK
ncbi:hypothetical protein ALQ46_200056 [Pseudomonas savastanoi pv. phaseolicola]|nr:hypothetical protein ALQ46_200056 [Pseudomonas savastanoi pv. phaseolicola]